MDPFTALFALVDALILIAYARDSASMGMRRIVAPVIGSVATIAVLVVLLNELGNTIANETSVLFVLAFAALFANVVAM